MARITYTEREAKLAAAPDFELPDLRGVVGSTERLPEQQLTATYLDTSDLRLWQLGITFRHRTGEGPLGPDSEGVWTLKLPLGGRGATLDRQELTWVGDRATIPEEARRILRGVVRRASLDTVTVLVTDRRRLLLRDRRGEAWAEVDDDTVTVRHGSRDGLIFRQIEVEMAGTADEGMDRVLAKLRDAGARDGDREKLAKVLGPHEPESGGSGRSKRASVGAAVAADLAAGLRQLVNHDVGLRLDPEHPPMGDVHRARVATRRLRSDLKTLAPLLDPLWVSHTRAELKALGEALGEVRDVDVLIERLDLGTGAEAGGASGGPGSTGEGRRVLAERLDAERVQAAGALAELIRSDRYLNLLDRLHAASRQPPLLPAAGGGGASERPASQVLPPLVHQQWRTLRRRVRHAGRHPSDARLHRIRIGAKQLRYASELAEPVVGKPARRAAAAAAGLQTVLGDHHDAVVAEAWLHRAGQGEEASPAGAFRAGILTAEQRRVQRGRRREWRASWRSLNVKKQRRWMR